MDLEFIVPSLEEKIGQRTKRVFDRDGLYQIGFFMTLLRYGISRKEASGMYKGALSGGITKALLEGKKYFIRTDVILPDGLDHEMGLHSKIPVHLRGEQIAVMIVNLESIKEEVEHRLQGR